MRGPVVQTASISSPLSLLLSWVHLLSYKVPQPQTVQARPTSEETSRTPSPEGQLDLWSNLPTAALQPPQEERFGRYVNPDYLRNGYPFIQLRELPEQAQENLVRHWLHSSRDQIYLNRSQNCIACWDTNLNSGVSPYKIRRFNCGEEISEPPPLNLTYNLRKLCPLHYREINQNELLKIDVLPNLDKIIQNDRRTIRVATSTWNHPQVRSFPTDPSQSSSWLPSSSQVPTPTETGESSRRTSQSSDLDLPPGCRVIHRSSGWEPESLLLQGLGIQDFTQGVLDL